MPARYFLPVKLTDRSQRVENLAHLLTTVKSTRSVGRRPALPSSPVRLSLGRRGWPRPSNRRHHAPPM